MPYLLCLKTRYATAIRPTIAIIASKPGEGFVAVGIGVVSVGGGVTSPVPIGGGVWFPVPVGTVVWTTVSVGIGVIASLPIW